MSSDGGFGRWLMRGYSIRLQIIGAILVALVVVALAGSLLVGDIYERDIEAAASQSLRRAAGTFANLERSEIEKLSAILDGLLAMEGLKKSFLARDRERLLAEAAPIYQTLRTRDGITHWYFLDPEPSRTCFLRVHRPGLHGDRVDRVTLQAAIRTKDGGSGMELGQTAFALRVVRPYLAGGEVIGYLELAEEIDQFLDRMKALTGDDYGLLVKKKFLDEKAWAAVAAGARNTWNDRPETVVVGTTTFSQGIIDYRGDVERIPDGGLVLDEAVQDGRAYIRGMFPVRDAAGRTVGGLFVLHDFTEVHRALASGRTRVVLVVLAMALLMAVLLVILLDRLVFTGLVRLAESIESLPGRSAPGAPRRISGAPFEEDEIARLEEACLRLAAGAGRERGSEAEA